MKLILHEVANARYTCKHRIYIYTCRDPEQPFARCEHGQVFGDMSPYFDWVRNAKYAGRKTFGEEGYDFWEIEVSNNKP